MFDLTTGLRNEGNSYDLPSMLGPYFFFNNEIIQILIFGVQIYFTGILEILELFVVLKKCYVVIQTSKTSIFKMRTLLLECNLFTEIFF